VEPVIPLSSWYQLVLAAFGFGKLILLFRKMSQLTEELYCIAPSCSISIPWMKNVSIVKPRNSNLMGRRNTFELLV
jgi:hypothetical protein